MKHLFIMVYDKSDRSDEDSLPTNSLVGQLNFETQNVRIIVPTCFIF